MITMSQSEFRLSINTQDDRLFNEKRKHKSNN